jgi:hypothetical protein
MNEFLTRLFDSMTREELRILAKVLGIRQGRNKADTCISIDNAMKEGKAQVKYVAFIVTPPGKGIMRERTIFTKAIRPGVIQPMFLPEEKEIAVAIDLAQV